MAEAILSSIAEEILKKLGSRVLREIGLWWGLNDELKKLAKRVSTVQAVLLDAEEKSYNNEVKVWLGQLKQAFYEADDLLDDFSTEALRQKVMPGNKISRKMRTFFSLSSNQIVYGIKMAHRVRDVAQRLNEIADSRKFHLDERFMEKSVVNIERDTHSSPPEIVVGREEDKRVIMGYLLSGGGVGVISIVGIGGLGKTTLAQSVFHDEELEKYFEPKLWVCVSDNFELKVIVGKILGADKSKDEDMNKLKDRLLEKIKGKRYLLVLDDVYSDDLEKWSGLTDLLVGGSKGSRIIVTTRLKKVAEMTQPIVEHEMRRLSEMDSWELFKQMAFKKGQACSDDHEKIGKEILKKCCGVPLAIRAIGRLLFFKESVAEWRAFEDKEIVNIDQAESSILPVLEISYNHLPSHLKNCFVYCRLFPKDWRIDVPKLINYWIAQGFVKVSDATQCPMDVGLEYFMELSWRSFFQEVEKDRWGNIFFCKMHDLIHDLAAKLASVESIMFDSVGGNVDGRPLHASCQFDIGTPWKLSTSFLQAGNLRTFLLLRGVEDYHLCEMEDTQWAVIISNFSRLRILNFNYSSITKIPHSITKLKHLRHLDLTFCNKIEVLHNSITKLYNLLTLILDDCNGFKDLPRDTKKLVNLTELSLERCFGLECMPQGIGQLTCLRKLSKFVVAENSSTTKHAGTVKELGGFNNLRGKLEISNLGYVRKAAEFQEANLKEKQHLQELVFNWGDNNNFEDVDGMALEALQPHLNLKGFAVYYYRGSKIPGWLSYLANLEQLELLRCHNCQHLPPMHQLCNLKYLGITELQSLEYIDKEPNTKSAIGGRGDSTSTTWASSFFPSLETLVLKDCPNLKGWWRTTPTQSPRFPSLSKLLISKCPKVTSMPLFPHLKVLHFGYGSVISLKEILNTSTAPTEECTSSSSTALSQLLELKIDSIEDLESLPEDLAQNLHSLKTLSIDRCTGLKTLGPALQHLTSLEELKICSDLNLFEEAMHWKALRSLRSLSIIKNDTLEFFPSWFQQVMPSLQFLYISRCHFLKCLPKWMGQLPSLQNLIVKDCPELSARCGSKEGADWPNIASIPNIIVDDKDIELNGHYMLS